MLFTVCLEGAQIMDPYGPLQILAPVRDRTRPQPDEIQVLFDEAPTIFRDYQFGYSRTLKGYPQAPRPLTSENIAALGESSSPVARVLIVNAFGGGYGDILIGSAIVEALYRKIQDLGKIPQIDFLLHPLGFERQRHFEIYKLNPWIHRFHYTHLPLSEYLTYDLVATTENYVADPAFRVENVYDYHARRVGLSPEEVSKIPTLYLSSRVLDAVWKATEFLRADRGAPPLLLLNLHATNLRSVPPRFWEKIVQAFIKDYRVGVIGNPRYREEIVRFVREHKSRFGPRLFDLTEITEPSFDYLIALIHQAADVVLTPDTAMIHICGALGKPCVGIFVTIEPELRIRDYPTVLPYCLDVFRQSRFWGLSKITEPEDRAENILEDPEIVGLWEAVKMEDLRREVARAQTLPRPEPRLVTAPYLHRGSRPLVYVIHGAELLSLEDREASALLSHILPPDCQVERLTLRPLEFRSLARCDLLLLGLGSCLYDAYLMQPALVDYVGAAKRSVGYFGLQYKASISEPVLHSLLDALGAWFTTSGNVLREYGVGRSHADAVGEWRALFVPLGSWMLDEELSVTRELEASLSWDALLQKIQRYRRVECRSITSLLCALGVAEEIRFIEPRDAANRPSGRLGDCLTDLCGKPVEEGTMLSVVPEQVIAYKKKVEEGVRRLRTTIATLLG